MYLFSISTLKCHKISCHTTKSIFLHYINLLVAKTLNKIYFMVSLLNKSFWLTYHKLAPHNTEYILALYRFYWTTTGVWGPSSRQTNVILFHYWRYYWYLCLFVCRCFPRAVWSYCFQDPLPISKYGRHGFRQMKNSNKIGKNCRKR